MDDLILIGAGAAAVAIAAVVSYMYSPRKALTIAVGAAVIVIMGLAVWWGYHGKHPVVILAVASACVAALTAAFVVLVRRYLGRKWTKAAVVFAVLATAAVFGLGYVGRLANEHWITCVVTDKEPVHASGLAGRYQVHTAECGVLSNKDSVFHGKFYADTNDLQNSLTVGKRYRLLITGSDLAWWTRNILQVQ